MCLDSYRAVCSESADLEFVSLYLFPSTFLSNLLLRVIGSSHMATCPKTILESCFYLPYCYEFGPMTFFNLGDCISTPKTCLDLFFKVYFPVENFITIYRFLLRRTGQSCLLYIVTIFLCFVFFL